MKGQLGSYEEADGRVGHNSQRHLKREEGRKNGGSGGREGGDIHVPLSHNVKLVK